MQIDISKKNFKKQSIDDKLELIYDIVSRFDTRCFSQVKSIEGRILSVEESLIDRIEYLENQQNMPNKLVAIIGSVIGGIIATILYFLDLFN